MEQEWYYSPDHGQLCQVIEAQTLWGETTCRVWLPDRDSVVRIPASRLKSQRVADVGVMRRRFKSNNNVVYSLLYKLMREGSVPCQKVGKHRCFRKEAMDDWLRWHPEHGNTKKRKIR